MKEDATAQELGNLLRDALSNGFESPRGETPILQLDTMPLPVQRIPIRPVVEAVPESVPRLAPVSVSRPETVVTVSRTKRSSRTPIVAFAAIGLIALAAASGGIWMTKNPHALAVARRDTSTVVSPEPSTHEHAVAIALASRPTETLSEAPARENEMRAAAKPSGLVDAKMQTTPTAANGIAPPEPTEARPKIYSVTATSKPLPEKTEKIAAEKREGSPPPPTPAPPSGGSVDALLEQQLKGAIP